MMSGEDMGDEDDEPEEEANGGISALQDELRNLVKGGMYQTLYEAFQDFDTDGDNMISKREFKQAINKLGMKVTEAELKELRKGISTSEGGRISYEDLEAFMMSGEPEMYED